MILNTEKIGVVSDLEEWRDVLRELELLLVVGHLRVHRLLGVTMGDGVDERVEVEGGQVGVLSLRKTVLKVQVNFFI